MGHGVEFPQTGNDFTGLNDVISEQLAFRGTHPAQLQPFTADAGQFEQGGQGLYPFLSIKITILVMTFTRMSPGHKNAVVTSGQAVHDK